MRFLRQNTATRITVGPMLDKTTGVDPEVSLTVTSCKLTLMVDDGGVPTLVLDANATASGGANDMVHVTGDDAGFYDLELAAANVNYLGRAMLAITDAATHCPVFHEFMILPAVVYDAMVLGTDNLDVNAVQHLGTAYATPTVAGVPEVDVTHWIGTAAATPTVAGVPEVDVTYAGGVILGGIGGTPDVNVISFSGDITAADNAEAFFDGTGYAGGTVRLKVDVDQIQGDFDSATAQRNLSDYYSDHSGLPVFDVLTGAITAASFAANAITATSIAANAITDAKVASDVTIASVTGAVGSIGTGGITTASFAAGAINAAAIAADAITDAKVASDVTIASVTGAVGSVTGSIGGNLAGSVGSITTGGITASSFAAGAIDAAAIAANAITAAKLHSDVTTELQAGLSTLTEAQVNAQVDIALADYDAPTNAEMVARTLASASYATAAALTTAQGTLTKLDGMLVLDGAVYQFTANAVELAPTGGSAPTAAAIADEVQTRTIAAVTTVGSVSGAVGSVTGAVGSVTGNVGGNVVGTVASVVGAVGSVTGNIGGTVASVVGAVGSVTGAVGSVTGAVGSVTGNVGGNVVGSVGSVTTGGITTGSFATGAITAGVLAADVITAAKLHSDVTIELQSGLSTAAALSALQADATTMLSRLSSARAGYLDYLNVGGPVASQADIDALNQSASRRIILTTVEQFTRPASGTTIYTIEARTFDADGIPFTVTGTPTLTGTGATSGSLAANIAAPTNPETGVYRWAYSVHAAAVVEPIRFDFAGTVDGDPQTMSVHTQVVDTAAAVDFTTDDRTKLTAISNKLGSKAYLAGTDNSSGAIEASAMTGNFPGSVGSVSGNTAQTGDVFALANGASGFVAIKNAVTTAQATLTKLDGMLVLDGATYQFTANALENGGAGGGGSDETNVEIRETAVTIS